MRTIRYPSSVPDDFTGNTVRHIADILNKPPHVVLAELSKAADRGDQGLCLGILRASLDHPSDEQSIVIVGWFVMQGFVPKPTLFIFMNYLLSQLNSKRGLANCVLFARSILPLIPKYAVFTKSLISVPRIRFQYPDLFIVLSQFLAEKITLNVPEFSRTRFVAPPFAPPYSPPHPIPFPKIYPRLDEHSAAIRPTLSECIQVLRNLRPPECHSYIIEILRHFSPPTSPFSSPLLLEVACG
jgi:hypothetical protein